MLESNMFDSDNRPDFMNPYKRRVISEHIYNLLEYPVSFEGQDKDGDWHVFFTAQNVSDIEFKLQNFGIVDDYVAMRAVSANGRIFHHTMEDIIKVEKNAEQTAIRQTSPIKQFINSSPLDALRTAGEIMKAAESSQHFTIPHRAVLLLNHPALHRIIFVEFDDCVACRLFTTPQQFESNLTVMIWKRHHPEVSKEIDKYKLPDDFPMFAMTPKGLPAPTQAFLFLLCASIVRDFWVLNEVTRRQTYQSRTEKKRRRVGKGKDRKLDVQKEYTFIPRFKYDLDAYDTQSKSAVTHNVRVTLSPALVSGHIRRLPEGWKTSKEAKENAEEFGISILEPGTTFVRPHERGEIEQLRNYRSRSALKLLFEKEESQ